jgi:hypothetical protein
MYFEGKTRAPSRGGDVLDTSDRSFGHFFGQLGPKMTEAFLIFQVVRHFGGVGSELRHFSVVLKLAPFFFFFFFFILTCPHPSTNAATGRRWPPLAATGPDTGFLAYSYSQNASERVPGSQLW